MAVGQDQRRVEATATRRSCRPKFAMRLASGAGCTQRQSHKDELRAILHLT